MPLTNLAIKQAKPKEKDYKLAAGKGLYLLVKTTGSKYWRMKFRFAGKEKTLAFGVYPEITPHQTAQFFFHTEFIYPLSREVVILARNQIRALRHHFTFREVR
jgi:hypothetical protein